MDREFWIMSGLDAFNWVSNIAFSGILSSFQMSAMKHERKKVLIGKDLEYIKNLCKL